MRIATPLAVSLAALALGAAGCSVSLGSSVSQSDVEKEIASGIEAQIGEKPSGVSCPGSLKGEVDTTMDCTATSAAGSEYAVAVTVNSVEDSKVNFTWEITTITTVGAADIAQALQSQLEVVPVEDIECADSVKAAQGQTQTCTVNDTDGTTFDVTATVESVEGATANFGFEVVE